MSLFEARPLPWHVKNPYDGCNADEPEHNHMQCSVWDNDGNLVCECMGEDEGRREAIAIATAVNRSGPKVCAHCDSPATCFGSYEDDLSPAYACDECCGHGCEDGHCERMPDAPDGLEDSAA
jgi:hypothetical protein